MVESFLTDYRRAILTKLFEMLSHYEYAVLRGAYSAFEESAGDIDLVIQLSSYEKIISAIEKFSEKNNLAIRVLDIHDHGCIVVLAGLSPWFFLKLDMHFYEAWRGLKILTAEEIIAKSTLNSNGVRVSSELHQSVMNVIRMCLYGGTLKPQDHRQLAKTYRSNNHLLIEQTRTIVNPRTFKKLVSIGLLNIAAIPRYLRILVKFEMIFRTALNSPLYFIKSSSKHTAGVIRSLIRPRGYKNQFALKDLNGVGLTQLANSIRYLAPGYPIKVEMRKSFISLPMLRKFRSYEAVIYYQAPVSETSSCFARGQLGKEGLEQLYKLLQPIIYECVFRESSK